MQSQSKYPDLSAFEHSENRPAIKQIQEAEKYLECTFGIELKHYLRNYGYLANEDVEFYGIDKNQGLESDIVVTTGMLRGMTSLSNGKTAILKLRDSCYILADSNDVIYICNLLRNTLTRTPHTFYSYVSAVLQNAGLSWP